MAATARDIIADMNDVGDRTLAQQGLAGKIDQVGGQHVHMKQLGKGTAGRRLWVGLPAGGVVNDGTQAACVLLQRVNKGGYARFAGKVRLQAQCAGFSELVDCGTMVAVADDDRLASLDELACAVQTNAAGGTGNKNGERGGQTDTSVVSGLPIVVWLVRLPSSLIQINIFSCYLLYRRLPPWGLRECFLGGCMRIVVVSGTVFGTAEEVAWRASELLSAAGLDVAYQQHWQLQELLQQEPDALLLIASTTGMGELPERLQPLVDALQAQQPDWAGRPVGIIGLGDAGYGDNFCLAADELEALADELGLVMLQDTLRLDASESVTPEQDAVPWLQEFAELLVAWSS